MDRWIIDEDRDQNKWSFDSQKLYFYSYFLIQQFLLSFSCVGFDMNKVKSFLSITNFNADKYPWFSITWILSGTPFVFQQFAEIPESRADKGIS